MAAAIRYDKNNPRWDAAMFAGVEHNTAVDRASSLTDEAIALWNALMATGSGAVFTKYLVDDAYGIERRRS